MNAGLVFISVQTLKLYPYDLGGKHLLPDNLRKTPVLIFRSRFKFCFIAQGTMCILRETALISFVQAVFFSLLYSVSASFE
jgi:hypothetical protein